VTSAAEGTDAATNRASQMQSYGSFIYTTVAGSEPLYFSDGQSAPELRFPGETSYASVKSNVGPGYCGKGRRTPLGAS
jgi:hypothetical protein